MSARLPLAALFVALLPCVAVAQEIPWQAERVMLRRDGVRAGRPVAGHLVRQGKELPADGPYTVLRADGGLLELGDNCGWVARADVVKMTDAVGYFTARIQEEPTAAKWYGRRAVANSAADLRVSLNAPAGQSRAVVTLPTEIIEDLDSAVRLAPDDTTWRGMLAVHYASGGKLDKAVEQCEIVLRFAPNDASSYTGRAGVRMLQGDMKGAIADSERAAELAPNSIGTLVALASVYQTAGQGPKAVGVARRALDLPASTSDDYHRRAMACVLIGDQERLVAAFNQVLLLDPTRIDLRIQRAGFLRMSGKYHESLADLRIAARLNPGDPQPLRREAFLLATCKDDALRDGRRAVELAKRALALGRDDPDVYALATLAAAYAEVGDFPSAIATQKRAMKVLEGKPNYYDEVTGFRWWLDQYERDQPRRE